MPPAHELRLGTRGSQLALWQANAVAASIRDTGGPPCRLVVIRTTGDHAQDAPLSAIGGKRLFVKEIEDALLRDEIDLAVHSSKDMPARLPDGLVIAAVLPRADPHDAIVLPAATRVQLRSDAAIDELVTALGQTPSFGTGSVRRVAQLSRLFPQARFAPIRGNLDTRLRKLDDGEYEALVLAAAGLHRLGFANRISFVLPPPACVPAPGQGIVAIEVRDGDRRVADAVRAVDDAATAAALKAERALIDALGGGCQTPIGALATAEPGGRLTIVAIVIALDGSEAVRATADGTIADAADVGIRAAAALLEQGAETILADAQGRASAAGPPEAQAQSAALTDD